MSPFKAALVAQAILDAPQHRYELALARLANAIDEVFMHKGIDGVQRAVATNLSRLRTLHIPGEDGWIG